MIRQARNLLVGLRGALLIGAALALVIPQAHAGAIATDDALSAAQTKQDRERLKALVARPELARQLEKMGLAPKDAGGRVAAMNDAEVRTIVGRLDALPAGGALTNTDILLALIIVILLVVLL